MDISRCWYKPKGYSATLSQAFQAKNDAPKPSSKHAPPLTRSSTSLEISRPKPIRPRSNSAPNPNGGSVHQRSRSSPSSSPRSQYSALSGSTLVSSIAPLPNPHLPLRPRRRNTDGQNPERERGRERDLPSTPYPPLRRKGRLPAQTPRQWRTDPQLQQAGAVGDASSPSTQPQPPRNGYHYIRSRSQTTTTGPSTTSHHSRAPAAAHIPNATRPPVRPSIEPLPLSGGSTRGAHSHSRARSASASIQGNGSTAGVGIGTGKSWYLPRVSEGSSHPGSRSQSHSRTQSQSVRAQGTGRLVKAKDGSISVSVRAKSGKMVVFASPEPKSLSKSNAETKPAASTSTSTSASPLSLAGRLIKLFQHKFLNRC